MSKLFFIVCINIFCFGYTQSTCEDNCGSGTLQEYFDDEVKCVCNLDCAGYGNACCDYYEACYENPSYLEYNDFIGTWSGNITNDQTWSFDYPLYIQIESNNTYSVPYNPGNKLVSDQYPGTEEVYYDLNTNTISFRWIQYYHYSCGGGCYIGVDFQVMEQSNGQMTLFYNNGSSPAPQAYSMYLNLDGWISSTIGDINEDSLVNINDVVLMVNIILNASEYNDAADVDGDQYINIQDIILLIQMIISF